MSPCPPVPIRDGLRAGTWLAGLCVLIVAIAGAGESPPIAVTADSAAGRELVRRLRLGGHVLFFRHADTTGMPCDRSYRIDDRPGQRNLSAEGREQARRIGARLEELAIPVGKPVLAGPVYRARDTAELAFGAGDVEVTDSLLADDYAGAALRRVLEEHLRLFADPVPPGLNRVLVGHRTPAIMVLGDRIAGEAFPEGSALILEPRSPPVLLGILALAPLPGRGFHSC